MLKRRTKGKYSANNFLTHKGIKVFHRRNKVKTALAITSVAAGVGGGIGIAYAIFHKDTPEPTPILTSLTLSYGSNEYSFTVGSSQSIGAPTLKDNNGNNATATFSCNNLPSWLQLSTQTGAILVEPTETGDFEITITANGTGEWDKLSTSKNILIKVTDSPIPTPTEISLSYSSDEYTFDNGESSSTGIPTLKDNNNQDVTAKFSCIDILPDGLDINKDTGEIFGTPDIDDEQTITVTANGIGEWTGLSSSTNITIKVVSPTPSSITLTYDSVAYQFNKDEVSSTGIPVLKDNLGLDVTATFEVTGGELPDELTINSSTGEISGTPTTKCEENITITATGEGLWNGLSCDTTLIINVVFNNIILTDNTMVDITDPDGLMVFNTNSSTRLNNTTYTSAAISDVSLIKEIHITPDQTITSAPANYGRFLCSDMTNLTVADINLPPNITSIGDSFCSYMFYYCTSIASIPSGFNLPHGITGSVGSNFCDSMFSQCPSLTTLPSGFNLPSGITSADTSFCSGMFSYCSSLTTLPSGFNLPQSIVSVGNYFCSHMFWGSSIASIPSGFNLPQGITSIGNYFCSSMFYNCSKLTTLPTGFNLPSGITSVGNSFCWYMFNDCHSLTTLPTGFNLPQGITSVGTYFCSGMFYNCSALGGTGTTGDPNFYCGKNTPTGKSFASNMFSGVTILIAAGCPETPTNDQLKTGYNIARS